MKAWYLWKGFTVWEVFNEAFELHGGAALIALEHDYKEDIDLWCYPIVFQIKRRQSLQEVTEKINLSRR